MDKVRFSWGLIQRQAHVDQSSRRYPVGRSVGLICDRRTNRIRGSIELIRSRTEQPKGVTPLRAALEKAPHRLLNQVATASELLFAVVAEL